MFFLYMDLFLYIWVRAEIEPVSMEGNMKGLFLC